MTWLDIFLVFILAALTALGAKRKLAGLMVGVVGFLLFRPLLVVFTGNAYLGLILALPAGFLLGFMGRAITLRQRALNLPLSIAGGLGGALLGLLIIATVATSFPLGRSIIDPNIVVYPSDNLTPLLRSAAKQSPIVKLGHDILLYPLLEQTGQIPAGRQALYKTLHSFLIVGKPWEGG
jgi:hypothetical protein